MKCEYDVAYLSYIYDNLKTRDGKSCNEWIEKEVRALEPNLINYDDKTLAAVIDASAKLTPQRPEYYKYPSRELWNKLLAKQEGELYPYRKRKLPQVLERARPPVQAPPPPRPEMRDPQRDILRLRLKRTRYLALAELIIIVILALSLFAPKKPPGEDIPEPSPTETSTPTPTDTEVETTTGTPTGTPAVTPTATPAELSPEPPPETSPETSPESEPEESEAPDSAGWEQEL
jgi:hypothetical protein